MEPAKTISVVCPENLRAGYKNIPITEFDPAIHVPFDRETGLPAAVDARAGARHAPEAPIEIPADWQSLHWKQRVALAEKLNGADVLTPANGETQGEAADAVITAEVARRAGNGA